MCFKVWEYITCDIKHDYYVCLQFVLEHAIVIDTARLKGVLTKDGTDIF